MNYTLLIICMLLLGSCGEIGFLEHPSKGAQLEDYYLNFDIKEVDYNNTTEVDSFHVETIQSLSFKLDFEEVSNKDYHRIPFSYYSLGTSPDSLILIGNIRFMVNESSKFEEEVIDIEFFLLEDKTNLIQLTDSTYEYISNKVFYDHLEESEWGNKSEVASDDPSQLLLTIPYIIQDMENGWDLDVLSTSGFYFQHEQLALSEISYDELNDAIEVSGHFDVELKILSCGFYSFFSVTNAKFKALIK